MKKIKLLALMISCVMVMVLASACGEKDSIISKLEELNFGDTYDAVVEVLGEPSSSSQDDNLRWLDFDVENGHGDDGLGGKQRQVQCTLEDGKFIGYKVKGKFDDLDAVCDHAKNVLDDMKEDYPSLKEKHKDGGEGIVGGGEYDFYAESDNENGHHVEIYVEESYYVEDKNDREISFNVWWITES